MGGCTASSPKTPMLILSCVDIRFSSRSDDFSSPFPVNTSFCMYSISLDFDNDFSSS